MANRDWNYLYELVNLDTETETKMEQDLFMEILNNSQRIFILDFFSSEEEQLILKSDIKLLFEEQNLIPDNMIVLASGEYKSINRLYDA